MSLIAKGFNAAKLLISFQLVLKIANFGLGILIARITGPEAYGGGHVHVNLVTAVILHLSRETFRKIALRSEESPYGMMWVSVGVTWSIALITYAFIQEYSTLIICLAAMIEVLCEPFHISHIMHIEVKSSITAESFSTLIHTAIIIIFHKQGMIAFCYANLATAITNLFVYVITCPQSPFKFKVICEDKALAATWIMVGFIKFFLNEGERLFLTYMAYTEIDKGVYSLISNLCWMIPSMFFRPIEEVMHIVFTKKMEKEEREEGVVKVFRMIWIISLSFVVYSQVYADLAITVLYGEKWKDTDAARGLALYGFYVVTMGVFGTSDAIFCGIASSDMIARKKYSMTVCFIVYMSSAYVLTPAGSTGLILASIITMLCRIRYILKGLFSALPWLTYSHLLPSQSIFIIYFITYSILKLVSFFIYDYNFIIFGAIVLITQFYFIYKENINILKDIENMKKTN